MASADSRLYFTPAEVDAISLPKFDNIAAPKLVRIPYRSCENTAYGKYPYNLRSYIIYAPITIFLTILSGGMMNISVK
jgi:hypothetical protein